MSSYHHKLAFAPATRTPVSLRHGPGRTSPHGRANRPDVRWPRYRGQDAGRYFGSFLEPATWIAARQAIVDGEVIALGDAGEPDFARLQAGIKNRAGPLADAKPFLYEVFDLLYLDGRSLLAEPLEDRRRLLADVLRPDPRVRLSEHVERDGLAFFEVARARGLEGIMAKDRRAPYQPGLRTLTWCPSGARWRPA